MRFIAGLAICCSLLGGCSSPKRVEAANAPASGQQPGASTATLPANQQASVAPTQDAPVTDKLLAKDKQEYELAKLGYAKDPASKTAKDTYVFTTVRYGLAKMDPGNSEDSKVKYPDALRLFREALKVDPANADAQKNEDLIESIYKQMKRPIPN